MAWFACTPIRMRSNPLISLMNHPAFKNYVAFVAFSYLITFALVNSVKPFVEGEPPNFKALFIISIVTFVMFYLPLFPGTELTEFGFTVNTLFESLYPKQGDLLEYQSRKIAVHRLVAISSYLFLLFNVQVYIHNSTRGFSTIFLYLLEASIWLVICNAILRVKLLEKGIGDNPIRLLKALNMNPEATLKSLMCAIEEYRAHQFFLTKSSNKMVYLTNNGIVVFLSNWDFVVSKRCLCTAIVQDSIFTLRRPQHGDEIVPLKFVFADGINEPINVSMETSKFEEMRQNNLFIVRIESSAGFHKSEMEQFIAMFTTAAKNNSVYVEDSDLPESNELCLGCSIRRSNVKFARECDESQRRVEYEKTVHSLNDPFISCGTCSCRPIWCIKCVASLFYTTICDIEKWRSQSTPCPTCREHFCIEDVHLLARDSEEESDVGD
ncbi:unnamed protein product [Caenorhabditis auriculariae]|uniref:Uncharacterized protein n=1 Tax=Caenorhabditis auriculariae TaxID=2777116 RepID=A0A8S1H0Z0_9PELO|nr:unnamed protein product [Caenorhabditis auriculariae]